MRTLIGGTVPLIKPPRAAPGDEQFFLVRRDRGDAAGAWDVCVSAFVDSVVSAGDIGAVGAKAAGGVSS
jgi:hypothetical protein